MNKSSLLIYSISITATYIESFHTNRKNIQFYAPAVWLGSLRVDKQQRVDSHATNRQQSLYTASIQIIMRYKDNYT